MTVMAGAPLAPPAGPSPLVGPLVSIVDGFHPALGATLTAEHTTVTHRLYALTASHYEDTIFLRRVEVLGADVAFTNCRFLDELYIAGRRCQLFRCTARTVVARRGVSMWRTVVSDDPRTVAVLAGGRGAAVSMVDSATVGAIHIRHATHVNVTRCTALADGAPIVIVSRVGLFHVATDCWVGRADGTPPSHLDVIPLTRPR